MSETIKLKTPPKDVLLWSFDPHSGFDKPFHVLISTFGLEAIMSLDALVLEDTRNAARNAVKYHRNRMVSIGVDSATIQTQSLALAQAFGSALKDVSVEISHDPLLPEQAVYQPTIRPTQ